MARKRYYPGSAAGRQASDTKVRAFAKNLSREMLRKGWNQSDLARAAEVHLPKGEEFGRHLISSYVRGASMPNPVNLNAICKALGKEVEDLVPEGDGVVLDTAPDVKIEMLPNCKTRIRLDMELDTDTALQIAAIVNKAISAR